MKTHTHAFVRNDGETEIEVEYRVVSAGSAPSGMSGPPEDYDPGEGAEIEIVGATALDDGVHIELEGAERERIEQEIAENPDWWEDQGPDSDDWRDQRRDEELTG